MFNMLMFNATMFNATQPVSQSVTYRPSQTDLVVEDSVTVLVWLDNTTSLNSDNDDMTILF